MSAGWVMRKVRRAMHKLADVSERTWDSVRPPRYEDATRSALGGGLPIAEVRARWEARCEQWLPREARERMGRRFEANHPGYRAAVVAEAEAVLRQSVTVLHQPQALGERIDWHCDARSGFTWPRVHFSRIRPIDLERRADIKFPWELSRFHFGVTLGAAYWLTGEERYATGLIERLRDWVEANPPRVGVNWVCSMEVAIRAANLLWSLALIRPSAALDDVTLLRMFTVLWQHGHHLAHHLENRGDVRGNHYLSNLVGLLYLAGGCPWFAESPSWFDGSVRALREEMETQVLDDGVTFEASTSYHRLVTELMLHAVWLGAVVTGETSGPLPTLALLPAARRVFGTAFVERLERMCEFTVHATRPDGLVPQIGDNDSGRLVRFPVPGQVCTDHRHVLAVAGEWFDRPAWRCLGQPAVAEAIWLSCGFVNAGPAAALPRVSSRGFTSSGFYFLRHDDDYCAVHGAPAGCGGRGSHSHGDNLSVEWCAGGRPLLIDPGTGTYSRDPATRRLFRSTGYHNTVQIDGREQWEPVPGDLFPIRAVSQCRVIDWIPGEDRDVWAGEVRWNAAGTDPIVHRRRLEFVKAARQWTVQDSIEGRGLHHVQWFFHLAPGVEPRLAGQDLILAVDGVECGLIRFGVVGEVAVRIEPSWYSPHYDRQVKGCRVRYEAMVVLPHERTIEFVAGPLPAKRVACPLPMESSNREVANGADALRVAVVSQWRG